MGEKRSGSLACCGAAVLFGVLLAGCTTYSNQSFWEVAKAKAEFEGSNFRVRKLGVQGTAACPYLFGLTGQRASGIALGDANLLNVAMRDLHRQSDIAGKAAFLHNTNVEWTRKGIPFILLVQRVTITADVIEFHEEYRDYKPAP
jgi:hypothetical protein